MLDSPKRLFDTNQAKPDRDRMEAYINSLGEGFLAFDNSGRIELCNSTALDLLDSHGLVSQNIRQAVQLTDRAGQIIDLLNLAKSQGRGFVSQDYSFKKSSGSLERMDISLSPIIPQNNRFGGGFVLLLRPLASVG